MERAWVAGEYRHACNIRTCLTMTLTVPMPATRSNKIHARAWLYLEKALCMKAVWPTGPGEKMACNLSVVLNQLQDRTKNTRSNYLPLLKLAHDEDSADHQVAFWYGRELMYTGHHAESAVVLQRYLHMESALAGRAQRGPDILVAHERQPEIGIPGKGSDRRTPCAARSGWRWPATITA